MHRRPLPAPSSASGVTKGKCLFKEDTKEKGKASEMYKDIMADWENILNSEMEEEYADSILIFRELCTEFPTFVDYVENTILGPMKEKVVSAWTNRIMHLGNTTTNRVESTHARLKL
ncbi:protein FAR1-RELATED SEQUENCE 6-like, partial [Trifolium medium]|nr:protein FAR1-RELATED SEQUENCE 6-like [Trifolium medium]